MAVIWCMNGWPPTTHQVHGLGILVKSASGRTTRGALIVGPTGRTGHPVQIIS